MPLLPPPFGVPPPALETPRCLFHTAPFTKTQIRPHVLKQNHDAISRINLLIILLSTSLRWVAVTLLVFFSVIIMIDLAPYLCPHLAFDVKYEVWVCLLHQPYVFHCGLVLVWPMPLKYLCFYNSKAFISLICQTHLLWKLTATRNTDRNFPHNQAGATSNPIKRICSFSLLSLLQIQNTFSQTCCPRQTVVVPFHHVLACPPSPDLKKKEKRPSTGWW